MSRELLQQALDALESLQDGCTDSDDGTVEAITVWCPELIDALRAALAAPQPEPVAWMDDFGNTFPIGANKGSGHWLDDHKRTWVPLYATPQAIDGFGGNLDSAFAPAPAPVVPADMVMVEALRKARNALDGIDATACCDHWANMNSSGRRYAIARDARAAVQDIDRVLIAAAPAVPLTDEIRSIIAGYRSSTYGWLDNEPFGEIRADAAHAKECIRRIEAAIERALGIGTQGGGK